jgi:hypothetical protein
MKKLRYQVLQYTGPPEKIVIEVAWCLLRKIVIILKAVNSNCGPEQRFSGLVNILSILFLSYLHAS